MKSMHEIIQTLLGHKDAGIGVETKAIPYPVNGLKKYAGETIEVTRRLNGAESTSKEKLITVANESGIYFGDTTHYRLIHWNNIDPSGNEDRILKITDDGGNVLYQAGNTETAGDRKIIACQCSDVLTSSGTNLSGVYSH